MNFDRTNVEAQPRLTFLLALNGRSGTNYLMNLLTQHPAVAGADTPLWEDYILHESHHLRAFVDGVYAHWSRVTAGLAKPSIKNVLEESLGEQLRLFVSRGIDEPMVVLKSPTIGNVGNLYRFFPDAKLVILLRDGRDVAASGMRSFGWTLQMAVMAWAKAADELQAFCKQFPQDGRLIVHFEDLVRQLEGTLQRIFEYLDLDANTYDWQNDVMQHVVGSSDLRKNGGELHWDPVSKEPTFRPVGRWKEWSEEQKTFFEENAGRQLRALKTLT